MDSNENETTGRFQTSFQVGTLEMNGCHESGDTLIDGSSYALFKYILHVIATNRSKVMADIVKS